MHSLLAVPVAHGATVVGSLYLADKIGATESSLEDERVLTLLAAQAAVVIEKARLAEQVRMLAVVSERDRIGKDLHDGVIQALYAVTLELDSAVEDVEADPPAARASIEGTIDRVGDVIKDMRRYILGLQPADATAHTLPQALAALLAETRAYVAGDGVMRGRRGGIHPPAALAQDLLQIAREAVANAVRHAHAGRVWVTLGVSEHEVHMRIRDNGVGFDTNSPPPPGRDGLRNLHERAHGLGGAVAIRAAPAQGTAVEVRVPVVAPEREGVHV
jgi:signal transduction histidine kinase